MVVWRKKKGGGALWEGSRNVSGWVWLRAILCILSFRRNQQFRIDVFSKQMFAVPLLDTLNIATSIRTLRILNVFLYSYGKG